MLTHADAHCSRIPRGILEIGHRLERLHPRQEFGCRKPGNLADDINPAAELFYGRRLDAIRIVIRTVHVHVRLYLRQEGHGNVSSKMCTSSIARSARSTAARLHASNRTVTVQADDQDVTLVARTDLARLSAKLKAKGK